MNPFPIIHFYTHLTTSGNHSGTKMEDQGRAEGDKFGRVHIKFPIGKTYECHISDEEYSAKISASFFINCFVKLRLN